MIRMLAVVSGLLFSFSCKPSTEQSETKAIVDSQGNRAFGFVATRVISDQRDLEKFRTNTNLKFLLVECTGKNSEEILTTINRIEKYSFFDHLFSLKDSIFTSNDDGSLKQINCTTPLKRVQMSFEDALNLLGKKADKAQRSAKTQALFLSLRGSYSKKNPNALSMNMVGLLRMASENGKTLTSESELRSNVQELDAAYNPCLSPDLKKGIFKAVFDQTGQCHYTPDLSKNSYDKILESILKPDETVRSFSLDGGSQDGSDTAWGNMFKASPTQFAGDSPLLSNNGSIRPGAVVTPLGGGQPVLKYEGRGTYNKSGYAGNPQADQHDIWGFMQPQSTNNQPLKYGDLMTKAGDISNETFSNKELGLSSPAAYFEMPNQRTFPEISDKNANPDAFMRYFIPSNNGTEVATGLVGGYMNNKGRFVASPSSVNSTIDKLEQFPGTEGLVNAINNYKEVPPHIPILDKGQGGQPAQNASDSTFYQ